jgi:Zn-dependent protease
LIPLIGPAALLLVALLFQPATALHEVLTGFRQIAAGAIAPMSTAQRYIHATYTLASEDGFLPVLGLLAAKMAAFNLLPLPSLNGGQALRALLRVDRTTTPSWQTRLSSPGMLLLSALLVSWAVALCVFLAGARSATVGVR